MPIDTLDRVKLLSNSEALFRAMSDASPLGIFVTDTKGHCLYTNEAYQRISGQTLEQALGTNWTMAIHPEDRSHAVDAWSDALRAQKAFVAEVRFLRPNKSQAWIRLNAAAIRDDSDDNKLQGYVHIVEDISDRKAVEHILRVAEDALFEQQEQAQITLNSIGDGVLTLNMDGRVSYLNHKAELMTGWHAADAVGMPLATVFNVVNAASRKLAIAPINRTLKENCTNKLGRNIVLVRKDGSDQPIEDSIAPIHNRNGTVIGAVIVFHDVSETRAIIDKMTHLAQHDVLTGLPNRALLTERLTRAIGLAKRHKKQVALLFLDVDNFKHINDSLGHFVADQLLQSLAKRLQRLVRDTDTVCRQGGDEFVILLTEIEHYDDAVQVAKKLIAASNTPHLVDGYALPVSLSLSIGASIYPDDSDDVESIFKHADIAMYQAKACGRNNYQFFHTQMNERKQLINKA